MKKRFVIFFLFVLLIISLQIAVAHEGEEYADLNHSAIFPITQMASVGYGSAAFGILIFAIILFGKNMGNKSKKIMFMLIVAVAASVTIYLIFTTLYLNLHSETKGPVHWHADYEILVCDKKISLEDSKGMSNRRGVDMLHSHNDNRIHVEGVLVDKKEASLGAFFYAVHGSLSEDGLKIPTNDGLISVHNGDKCNDKPAKLYVFVNGKIIENPAKYVISPYERVPPGDMIKIVFTEKPIIGEVSP